jgi:hypothetical protein
MPALDSAPAGGGDGATLYDNPYDTVRAKPAAPAPSEDAGFTNQRIAMLAAHLFFSVAHIFAVHSSAAPHGKERRQASITPPK